MNIVKKFEKFNITDELIGQFNNLTKLLPPSDTNIPPFTIQTKTLGNHELLDLKEGDLNS